MYNSV